MITERTQVQSQVLYLWADVHGFVAEYCLNDVDFTYMPEGTV